MSGVSWFIKPLGKDIGYNKEYNESDASFPMRIGFNYQQLQNNFNLNLRMA
jgi:hypothetical protein